MADDAIGYIERLNALDPEKPFFVYYAPGATHAPHHPTQEWIDKFKGKFSMGWNELREQIFANQKRLGVIPQDAQLTPWPDDLLKNWDDLTADEKKLFERQMEVYAALPRLCRPRDRPRGPGDRGHGQASTTRSSSISAATTAPVPKARPQGTPNEMTFFNGVEVPVADQMKFYDVWGSDKTYPHYAVGWAWAMSTPYKWTKQVAGYFGGTRNGMVISWPSRIKDAGGIRTPVPPRHRHRADHPGSDRDSGRPMSSTASIRSRSKA